MQLKQPPGVPRERKKKVDNEIIYISTTNANFLKNLSNYDFMERYFVLKSQSLIFRILEMTSGVSICNVVAYISANTDEKYLIFFKIEKMPLSL